MNELSETEEATLARFGIQERFEAGTRTMFGHECKIVTDHHLGRFAMFVDATDTERIAEALNGGVTQVYVWRDDLAGDVVGTEQPAVGPPRDFDCCSGTGGHPNAHTGVARGFKRRDVVKDGMGNHFIVMDVVAGVVNCESVATREMFTIPAAELSATDREVF